MRSNPRISALEIHRNQNIYKNRSTTEQKVQSLFDKKIIFGPFLYTPRIKSFASLYRNLDDPFEEFLSQRDCPALSYEILLGGVYDLFIIKKTKDNMKYIVRNIHFTNGGIEKSEKGLKFVEKKGFLNEHFKPLTAKEYLFCKSMWTARKSYSAVAHEHNVSWMTARNYYNRIIKKVKVLVPFFPEGYSSYQYLFMNFSTRYEIGIIETLEQLPATSYLFLLEDLETQKRELAVVLFVHNINSMTKFFKNLEKEKKIENLKISIPIRFYSP